MLEPIFDEFADKVTQEYQGVSGPSSPTAAAAASSGSRAKARLFQQPGKVAVGKVNCEEEQALAQSNQINKYPTLKLYRHGIALKKEFRGAR